MNKNNRKNRHAMGCLSALALLLTACVPPGSDIYLPGHRSVDEEFRSKDGVGTNASFAWIDALSVNPDGTIFLIDGQSIRKIASKRVVSTLALHPPREGLTGLASLPGNILYAIEYPNQRIVRIDANGSSLVLAGSPYKDETGYKGWIDAPGTAARFCSPKGLCLDGSGSIIVADTFNHRIRKIASTGMVTTIAGSGDLGGFNYAGGFADGPALEAKFRFPARLALDASGSIFIADDGNHRIRKLTPEGVVTTVVELPQSENDPYRSQFSITGIAVEASNSILVAYGPSLLRVSPEGQIATLYSSPTDYRIAHHLYVHGVAVGEDDTIYFNDRFRVLTLTGGQNQVEVLAGSIPPLKPVVPQ